MSHSHLSPQLFKRPEFVKSSVEIKPSRKIDRLDRPYPQFYKIVLRSKDKIAGTNRDAQFRVSMSDRLHAPAVMMVESFCLQDEDSPTENLLTQAVEMRLRGIPQPRTYDSSTQSTSDLLCSFVGYTYYNQSPSADGAGIAITDPNLLQNGLFNIYFKKVDDTDFTLNEFNGDWILTLLVVPYDGSVQPYGDN